MRLSLAIATLVAIALYAGGLYLWSDRWWIDWIALPAVMAIAILSGGDT